jgi:hypothetical protein
MSDSAEKEQRGALAENKESPDSQAERKVTAAEALVTAREAIGQEAQRATSAVDADVHAAESISPSAGEAARGLAAQTKDQIAVAKSAADTKLERLEPYGEGEFNATPENADAKADELMTPTQRKMSVQRDRDMVMHGGSFVQDMTPPSAKERDDWPEAQGVHRLSGITADGKVIHVSEMLKKGDASLEVIGYEGTVDGKKISAEEAKRLSAHSFGSERVDNYNRKADKANREVTGEYKPTAAEMEDSDMSRLEDVITPGQRQMTADRQKRLKEQSVTLVEESLSDPASLPAEDHERWPNATREVRYTGMSQDGKRIQLVVGMSIRDRAWRGYAGTIDGEKIPPEIAQRLIEKYASKAQNSLVYDETLKGVNRERDSEFPKPVSPQTTYSKQEEALWKGLL